MNTPEKCPKCGDPLKDGWDNVYQCGSAFYTEGPMAGKFEERQWCVRRQRDQLAERVRELEAWKESAMAMEREWDPNRLSAMLGGQLGEPQRAVIQREVPRLVERVKRLEEAAGLALGYAAKGDFETADEVLNQAKSQP